MSTARQRVGGFTYVGVLMLVALMTLALSSIGILWRTASAREKEAELLFVGDQFRKALESYRDASAGPKEYPATLEQLLEDRRLPTPRRHLRRIYVDPMTGSANWDLVRVGERIVGLRSRSSGEPFRKTDFGSRNESFGQATRYSDWFFSAETVSAPPAAVAAVSSQAVTSIRPVDPTPDQPPAVIAPEVPDVAVPKPPCEQRYRAGMARCAGLKSPSPALNVCRNDAYQDYYSCLRGR